MKKKKSILDISAVPFEKKLQKAELNWWQHPWVIICITLLLSAMDAATLFSLFDAVMTENAFVGRLLTAGFALTLNFIPLIAGYLLREKYYERSRVSPLALPALAGIFLLLWGCTVWLRFSCKELSFSGGPVLVNQAAAIVGNSEAMSSASTTDAAIQNSLTLLLSISPFVTSVINLFLGFLSYDPVKSRINLLKIRRQDLVEQRQELMAWQAELDIDRIEELRTENERLYKNASDGVAATAEKMKAWARFRLAEALGDPESISYLST